MGNGCRKSNFPGVPHYTISNVQLSTKNYDTQRGAVKYNPTQESNKSTEIVPEKAQILDLLDLEKM